MDLPDAIDVVRPSIVQITLLPQEPSTRFPIIGSGFLVGRMGYAVTARHVTRAATGASAGKLAIGIAQENSENMRGNFVVVDCDVIEEDPRHDLALLRLNPNPFEGSVRSGINIGGSELPLLYAPATCEPGRPRDGELVAVSGYPLGSPVLETSSGTVASAWAFDIQDIQPPGAPAGFTVPDVKDVYMVDLEANPGNSGGPVFRVNDAAVIGVCVATQQVPAMVRDSSGQPAEVPDRTIYYSSGLTLVVPIKYALDLLARHDQTGVKP